MTPTNAREVWRFRVNGTFQGSFLETLGGVVVFKFQDKQHWTTLASISTEGAGLWQERWEDFAYFRSNRNRLFVDGGKARRVHPTTGEVLAERSLGRSVEAHWALDAGPVYCIPEEKKYFGLDGETLETLWEWQDEKEDFTFDEGRLCREQPGRDITIHELPSLKVEARVPATIIPADGAHAHVGDLYCHFGFTAGGRSAVDLKTGEVAWRDEEPIGYGLISFDDKRGYSQRDGVGAYDLRSGKQIWNRTFGDYPTSRVRPEGGRVYVATGDRFVHVLDAETGETLVSHQLKFKLTGAVEPSPVVPLGENRIVVGTNKEIICLEVG